MLYQKSNLFFHIFPQEIKHIINILLTNITKLKTFWEKKKICCNSLFCRSDVKNVRIIYSIVLFGNSSSHVGYFVMLLL